MLTWRDNSNVRRIGIGTHTKLFEASSTSTSYTDITPSGFLTGSADSTAGGGYGIGTYGSSTYGTPRSDTASVQPATVWSLDTWGEYLVGCTRDDGKLYEWPLTGLALQISGAPTACNALIVTSERFLFALGAGGNPRRVQWSDQESNTTWTPTSTNQAGDLDLATQGEIVTARKIKGATLIFTTTEVHIATYQGLPYVYGISREGNNCGAISQGAVVSLDTQIFWMSKAGFWTFDGNALPLASDVSDYVYSDINLTQAAKISGFHNSAFGEVTWFYPSAATTENDRYVTYNYREGTWYAGLIERLCATDQGIFLYPLACDASGNVYEHEKGSIWGGDTPYAQTGDIMLAQGDNVFRFTEFIPDDKTLGDASATFYGHDRPDDTTSSLQSVTLASKTDVRFTTRFPQVRVSFSSASARWGAPALNVAQGGRR